MSRGVAIARNLALAAVTFLLVWMVVSWLRHRDVARVHPRRDEVSVDAAAHADPDVDVAVRGYLFIDAKAGTLLCSERTTGKRPACAGLTLTLFDLDTSRIDLERADEPRGGYDAWSDGQVVLLGSSAGGGAFVVKDVLPA
jgi:hypothetical protein